MDQISDTKSLASKKSKKSNGIKDEDKASKEQAMDKKKMKLLKGEVIRLKKCAEDHDECI